MDNIELVPVFTGPLERFPASPEAPEGVKMVQWQDDPGGFVDIHLDVVYDERDGETLCLQILLPLEAPFPFGQPPKKRPLIVYVPGSAWRRQMPKMMIAPMMKYCRHGFAVAIVQYRPSDVAPFPAQIEDAKTAIRFMRKNAERYQIDPERVILFGDSSGGHTAVLAGITGDGLLDNGAYGEYSCKVNCIVDFFGPTDIARMNGYPSMMDHVSPDSPEGMFLGGVNVLENLDLAEKTTPMYYLSREKAVPPILILHGDRDELVPFNQSVRLYEKLRELGKEVEMYKLLGATHGVGGFHGEQARRTVVEFINRYI